LRIAERMSGMSENRQMIDEIGGLEVAKKAT
jgi:hypothetical protein